MAFKDSLGNVYAKLPAKKAQSGAKGASPGPKHGRKSKYGGEQKKHGTDTGRNGPRSRERYFGDKRDKRA